MEIDERALYKTIGEQIKARRNQAKLTQKRLADAIGVERTSITNIETGAQKLPIYLLYRICQEVGANVADVLPPVEAVQMSKTEEINIDGQSAQVPSKTAQVIRQVLEDFSKGSDYETRHSREKGNSDSEEI